MKSLGHSEREWVLLGMAESCAEKGFEGTSVASVCEAAGVTEGRFAELFDGREECLGAAMEWLVELAWKRLEERALANKPWGETLRDGAAALLELLAERPAFARLALIEAPVAGGRATILHRSAKASLLDFIERGEALSGTEIPASAGRGALAGVEALVTSRVVAGEAERLKELQTDVTFMLAVPYLGRAEATELSLAPRAGDHLRAVA